MNEIPCPACVDPADGQSIGADLSDPSLMSPCRRCGGRRLVPGRPIDWPPAGATLRSTERLDSFVVDEGDEAQWASPGLIPARTAAGARIAIRADKIGTAYEIEERSASCNP